MIFCSGKIEELEDNLLIKRVYISKFDKASALREKTLQALEWIEWSKIVQPEARVFIKPNLTVASYQPGVTVSPEMIEAIVSILRTRTSNIVVGESDGGYHCFGAEEAFEGHNVYNIADKHGAKVVNLCKTASEDVEVEIFSKKVQVKLPSILLHETDVFITIPVPKVHAMTGVSLAFKNQWGCIPDIMRLRNHPKFNEKIVAINKILNPQIVIFDGTYFLDRNGPQVGDPVRMDLIIASNDIGAGSFTCCKIMNFDMGKVKHFAVAQKMGMFPSSLDELILNDNIDKFSSRTFRLEKTLLNRMASIAFNSRLGTRLVYDSLCGNALHHVLYAIRKNRVIKRLLYGDIDITTAEH